MINSSLHSESHDTFCCPFPPLYLAMNTDRTQPDGEICLDGPAQNLTPQAPKWCRRPCQNFGGSIYPPSLPRHRVIYIHECKILVIDMIALQKSKNGCEVSKFQGCALEGVLEFMCKKLLYCDVFR